MRRILLPIGLLALSALSPLAAEEPLPPPASAGDSAQTTAARLDALRKEKDEIKRKQAASNRRLAFLEVEERMMEVERNLAQAYREKDDRKIAMLVARQGRLRSDRQWLEESSALEQQIDAAKDAGDGVAVETLARKLKKSREEREFATTRMDLDEARGRVKELEARLADLTARQGR